MWRQRESLENRSTHPDAARQPIKIVSLLPGNDASCKPKRVLDYMFQLPGKIKLKLRKDAASDSNET